MSAARRIDAPFAHPSVLTGPDACDAGQFARAFAGLRAVEGAERPGEDELLPAGPRVLPRAALGRLAAVTERLWAVFDAEVKRALGAHGAEAVARSLGFGPEEIALITAAPSLVAPPVRADFVRTRAGFRLVEWNVDPCLGGLASRALIACFARAGAMDGLTFTDPAAALAPSLAALGPGPGSRPRSVVVMMRAEDLPRWRATGERWVEAARAAGCDPCLATVDEAVHLAEAAPPTAPILLLRVFHVEHVPSIRAEIVRLLAAVRAGRARLVYGFDTELWGDKQWLARCALPPELARFVPEARPAREVEAQLHADPAAWVLKPHAGAAGEGVVIGLEAPAATFRRAVARAITEPGWIAQRFAAPRERTATYLDRATGRPVPRREVETIGVFLVGGRYAGAWTRSKEVGDGLVIDAGAGFNAVAVRAPAPGSPRLALAPDLELARPLRRLWAPAAAGPLRARLRSFEALAVTHLTGGGGALSAADPRTAGLGFARDELPELGEPLASVARELGGALLPFCHDKRAPDYFAHLDVPPADLSIAAGLLLRALAQDPVTWTSSRAGTFLEREVVRWFARLAFPGLAAASGIACAGGTQANLLAVLLARNLAFARLGLDVEQIGLAAAERRAGVSAVRVLVSRAAHGSVAAAARHAGLGDDGVIPLEVDEGDALRLDALEEALDHARRAGELVALLVLTAGTAGIGAVDPLPQALDLAARHGVRTHVDAAHGSMLLLSRRHAPRLAGLERADSVTSDPHKILGLNQGLGMLLLRDGADRAACAKRAAPYFAPPDGAPDDARFALDGTRPLHALGAWILLRHLGRAGYERVVDHLLDLSARFVEGLARTSAFELFAPPTMNLVAFRPRGAGDGGAARLFARVAPSRFRPSRYRSPRGDFLRAVFVNPATTGRHVDAFVRLLASDPT